MKTYRTNAVIAGVLYIIGTVAGILSLGLSQPLRDAPDPLAGAAANANQVTVAALLRTAHGPVARHGSGRAVPRLAKT